MKKYFISVFIPYLLLHLSGCYSMQRVTKEEFSPAPDYPELIAISKDKEYIFNEGSYTVSKDTIYGRSEVRLLKNPFQSFEGTISLNDVQSIQMNKSDNNSDTTELLVTTKDMEFIFKSEVGFYSVKNDSIYGVGKYRPRDFDEPFESKVAININDTEKIQIEKLNLTSTILWSALAVLTVVSIILMITNFKLDISEKDIWRSIGNNVK
jgi:hypothetical protein